MIKIIIITLLLFPSLVFAQLCDKIIWTAPTAYVDGTPLPVGISVSYNVYTGTTVANMTKKKTVTTPEVNCSDIQVVVGNFVGVTAFTDQSLESDKATLKFSQASKITNMKLVIQVIP